MQEEQMYDINEVCKMLNTTSRTLRFYEEKGIIHSSKSAFSSRRQYTEQQLAHIRNVIALRTLGLSVKDIIALQQNSTDLKSAVMSRRAEIIAIIEEKHREINVLNETLALLDQGEDIFQSQPIRSVDHLPKDIESIVMKCTVGIVQNDATPLYGYLSDKMKQYMPPDAYEVCRRDTLEPLGKFVSYGHIECDHKYPNVVYHYVEYEKFGLKIKYVFHQGQIHGFWMGYYHL